MATTTIRKGQTKTLADDSLGVPTDRKVKVLHYDDDNVIVEWESQAPVWGQDEDQPVTRTARLDRKVWDNA